MNRIDKKKRRRFEVLRELVEMYIAGSCSVSSEQICRNLKSGVSSATVRNTLAELDELEWTIQPHSSAGRIPSWKGYRAYVDILKPSDMSIADYRSRLEKNLDDFDMTSPDVGPALQRIAAEISEMSGCAGIVLSPQIENDFIREIKILPVGFSRALVVLISDFGLIRTETVQISRKLTLLSQKRVEEYLNARLRGKSDNKELIEGSYDEGEREEAERIYDEILLKYLISMRPRKRNEIFIEGIRRLFEYPEMQIPKAVQDVIDFFEKTETLVEHFRTAMSSGKTITKIGEELGSGFKGKGFCFIASPYGFDSINVGAVGLVGPMRLNYRAILPLIQDVSDFLKERLAVNFRKPRLVFDRDIPFKVI